MKVELFVFEDGLPVINKQWVRLIPEFYDILVRSPKIKGDSDGRDKKGAYAELAYIYFMEDYDSPYMELVEKERKKKAIRDAKIDTICDVRGNSIKWVEDELFVNGRSKYRELQESSLIRLLKEATRGINIGSNLIEFLNERVSEELIYLKGEKQLIDNEVGEDEKNKKIERINSGITLCFKAVDDIQALIKKLPDTLDRIKEIESKIKIEESNSKIARGGHRVGNRADPK